MNDALDIDALLRSALVPIEPSGALSDRLARGLSDLTDAAAGELADWELGAMRDPRNWARPAAAIVVGGAAAGALVLVRARQRHNRRPGGGLAALGHEVRGVAKGLGRRLGR